MTVYLSKLLLSALEHPKIRLPRELRTKYIKKVGDKINLTIPFQVRTWTILPLSPPHTPEATRVSTDLVSNGYNRVTHHVPKLGGRLTYCWRCKRLHGEKRDCGEVGNYISALLIIK